MNLFTVSSMLVSAVAAAALITPAAASVTHTLLTTGDAVVGTGQSVSQIGNSATLNDAGQVFLTISLTGPAEQNGAGLFLGAGNAQTVIARKGSPAAGIAAGEGVTYSGMSGVGGTQGGLNNSGQILFHSRLAGASVTFNNDEGVWRGIPGATPTLLARDGTTVTGSPYVPTMTNAHPTIAVINDAGQALFGTGIVVAGNVAAQALWLQGPTGNATVLAKTGDTILGTPGLTIERMFDDDSYHRVHFNNLGQAAFHAFTSDPGSDAIVVASGNGVRALAYKGMSAPGIASATLFAVNSAHPKINNSGRTAFHAVLDGVTVTDDNNVALYTGSPGSLSLIGRTDGLAPGTAAGTRWSSLSLIDVNDRNEVLISGMLKSGDASAATDSGLWIWSPTGTRLAAREGGQAPGLAQGVVYSGAPLSPFFFTTANEAGQYALTASLGGTGVTSANNSAIFIGDAQEQVFVVRKGDTLADGRTISTMIALSLNNHGQLLYNATFTNGSTSMRLFTPDLVYRSNASGAWDDYANWTAGINPAAVHDVTIAPTASLAVTGPSVDTSVKKLSVGGNGLTTLTLKNGATLTALQGTTIAPSGILTGDGALAGPVTNAGTVRATPSALLRTQGLTNSGIVTGDGALRTVLTNASAGTIQVTPGSTLHLVDNGGQSHTSAGLVEVIQGTFRVANPFVNMGLIATHAPTLRFESGLGNSGNLAVTGGTASVFGDVDNAASGKITLSGLAHASFYDDVQSDGTIHVAQGAVAVFLGSYTGAGAFTGTGTTFMEGDLRPGNSPAITPVEGDLTFGLLSHTVFELGGLLPAVQHDALHVGGHLALGGTLEFAMVGGFLPALGDSFDLLDWGSLSGQFTEIHLPAVQKGLVWDTSMLYNDGTVRVAAGAVPEPASLAILGLGVAGLLLRRKR